ncbi:MULTISPECIES: phosphatase [unclassified Romboutsia]|uniref:phosphatase n=1 Tax=unclassified Romboutsia TaxID=2626894 RepID=UPI000821D9C7|nr:MULTISPECIES: phosphatase [unclassified Romboutsia]SCH92856.1 Probable phosphatase YcdX [uncultured Clostridium sp.]
MKSILDLHTHTIVSGHAFSTIKENIEFAVRRQIKYLGISDHSSNMPASPHKYYFQNLKVIPREVDGVKILRGIEGNILDFEGNLDIDEDLYSGLDYVIASLHPPCVKFGSIEENTRAILNVMDIEKVRIIGHPDDSRYALDYEAVVLKAKEKNILLEINNSSLNPNSFREGAKENLSKMLELCKEHNVRVIMGTDSHICYDIGRFDNCEKLIKEVDFPKELVINYHEDQIIEFFNLDFMKR